MAESLADVRHVRPMVTKVVGVGKVDGCVSESTNVFGKGRLREEGGGRGGGGSKRRI